MNKIKLRIGVIFVIFAGLSLNSCKNDPSKNTQSETTELNLSEEVITSDFEIQSQNEEVANKVKSYIIDTYLTEGDLRAISEDQKKFQLVQIDLNNDGKNEVFVNFTSSYFCGTGGCTLLLLNDQVKPVTEFTVTRTPLYVEKTMKNGWRIILTKSGEKWRQLVYKNGSYPTNPSLVEMTVESPGENAEILFDEGNDNLKTYTF